MTWLLPFPLISAGLLVLWLLLYQSLSFAHIVLGLSIALVGGWALSLLEPGKVRFRLPMSALRLAGVVFADIVRSNFAVAGIVLGFGKKERVSGFVQIPLELRNRYGLTALAFIITSTPGTVWVDFNDTTGELTIHVLDLVQPGDWIATIKGRYERLLLEIFV